MDAFNLFYAVGSLIAAALVAAVVYLYWPVRDLMARDRFEEIFGFRPPKGKRGPGSRPISWDRRDEVAFYLRETALRAQEILREMRAGLRTLIDMEESGRTVRWPKHLIWNLAVELCSSYWKFYQCRKKFNRAYDLAVRFGFITSGRADDACNYFARIAKTQR